LPLSQVSAARRSGNSTITVRPGTASPPRSVVGPPRKWGVPAHAVGPSPCGLGHGVDIVEGVAFYRDQVLPRLVDCMLNTPHMGNWREQVAAGLHGRVVEIGFGSGLNVEHYPAEVEAVLAVEPAPVARQMARRRIAASGVAVEHVGTDAQSIPIEGASCDTALSTFTLCTVPDPAAALSEIFRVLRPGGRLHFLEHGVSPDPRVASWQRRLEPLQRRVANGCHLTRDPATIVARAGFQLERCEHAYAKGPKPWTYLTLGVAEKPR
jgi:SAM-dependent methyltransferase